MESLLLLLLFFYALWRVIRGKNNISMNMFTFKEESRIECCIVNDCLMIDHFGSLVHVILCWCVFKNKDFRGQKVIAKGFQTELPITVRRLVKHGPISWYRFKNTAN